MRYLWVISKPTILQAGQQIITIKTLFNISRSKDNHSMKFGHLIKYDVRSIFLQTSSRKWGGETSLRPLFAFKKSLI